MAASAITVDVGDLTFLAVPLHQARFDYKGAIYLIFELDSDGEAKVLDVGHSSENGEAPFSTPEQRESWLRKSATRNVWVGSYMEPAEKLFSFARNADEDRANTVERIRREYLVARHHL